MNNKLGGKHMSSMDTFRAINCAGSIIPDPDAVTAMCLLFDKVYLPNDLEIVVGFARQFRFKKAPDAKIQIDGESEAAGDPFAVLTPHQRATAEQYLASTIQFVNTYVPLYNEVFESPSFPDGSPLEVELIEKGESGQLNKYRVSLRKSMQFRSDSSAETARLIENGYVPLVGKYCPTSFINDSVDSQTSVQIANLLAMNALRLVLPRTRAASANTILEARERLKDHLPPFWASMLKMSRDLRDRIDGGASDEDLQAAATDMVDDTVRPALIELKHKMDLERKQWFYRILSPLQKGLRLLVGNPPLTQQQLLTNAMVLGSDVAMAGTVHMQQIEALKNSSGLTMLLEADQIMATDETS